MSAVLLFGCLFAVPVQSETVKDNREKEQVVPIVIKSKTLEMDNKLKVVTFTGDVIATKDDLVIDCKKMLVYFESLPGEKGKGETGTKINRIVATGDVKINRADGGFATGEKAVYYQKDERVVLTGKPVVRQGNDFVEGDRITFFLIENRSVVESSKGKKVKATIFPKREKR